MRDKDPNASRALGNPCQARIKFHSQRGEYQSGIFVDKSVASLIKSHRLGAAAGIEPRNKNIARNHCHKRPKRHVNTKLNKARTHLHCLTRGNPGFRIFLVFKEECRSHHTKCISYN